jgi:hypothetical protein
MHRVSQRSANAARARESDNQSQTKNENKETKATKQNRRACGPAVL